MKYLIKTSIYKIKKINKYRKIMKIQSFQVKMARKQKFIIKKITQILYIQNKLKMQKINYKKIKMKILPNQIMHSNKLNRNKKSIYL